MAKRGGAQILRTLPLWRMWPLPRRIYINMLAQVERSMAGQAFLFLFDIVLFELGTTQHRRSYNSDASRKEA